MRSNLSIGFNDVLGLNIPQTDIVTAGLLSLLDLQPLETGPVIINDGFVFSEKLEEKLI